MADNEKEKDSGKSPESDVSTPTRIGIGGGGFMGFSEEDLEEPVGGFASASAGGSGRPSKSRVSLADSFEALLDEDSSPPAPLIISAEDTAPEKAGTAPKIPDTHASDPAGKGTMAAASLSVAKPATVTVAGSTVADEPQDAAQRALAKARRLQENAAKPSVVARESQDTPAPAVSAPGASLRGSQVRPAEATPPPAGAPKAAPAEQGVAQATGKEQEAPAPANDPNERAARISELTSTSDGSGSVLPMDNLNEAISQPGVPDPVDVDYTPPLVQTMVGLFKLHGKSVSARLLMTSLPKTSDALHPSAVIRAAHEVGMAATTLFRPQLSQISQLTLPCILLLQGNRSCVVTKIEDEQCEVAFPENDMVPRMVFRQTLEKEYIGYAIFAKPQPKLDKRASEIRLVDRKRWFWGTLAHFLPIYKHVFGASIVVNLLAICGPLFFMNVYDKVVPNHATDTLWMLAAGIGLAYVFDFLLRNLRSYFVDVAGRNADIILASRLMQQVLSIRLDVKPDSTGSLANNLREFESLRDFFGSTTLMTLVDLPFLLLFVALCFIIGGPLGFIPLMAVPIVVGAGYFLQFPMQDVAEKGFKENMQKNALLVEIINGLETIKTTMAEGRIQHAWENVVGMSALSNSHSKRMANFSITLSVIITQLVSVFTIIWGVYRITDGSLSMGGLIACNMLAGRAMAPLSQVASMLTRLQQSRMALKSLDMLMSLDVEKPDSSTYVDFGYLDHSISLEDVCFKYPATERFAMERVNITIRPGERVGVIGRMGSGKSTFGRLCVGLYQPTEGAVKLGGVDIRQLDPVDLRSRVGYVSQDNYLFYGTVRENISFGSVNADDRMILRAANIAGVSDFVRAHPAGFGMPVGERGMSLSGGQRQSVAIARAILNNPDVLILDEPSSNMDNSSELALKNRLSTNLGDKTLILVTHRLSMLDLVQRLVVMDGGRIVADGPKNAVLNALRSEQLRLSKKKEAQSIGVTLG